MYDISTKKETQITTIGDAFGPNIYGKRIVWSDSVYPNKVYMYDIFTSQESVISEYYNSYVDSLSIYGDRVVWDDTLDDYMGISMYALLKRKLSSPTMHTLLIYMVTRLYGIVVMGISTGMIFPLKSKLE